MFVFYCAWTYFCLYLIVWVLCYIMFIFVHQCVNNYFWCNILCFSFYVNNKIIWDGFPWVCNCVCLYVFEWYGMVLYILAYFVFFSVSESICLTASHLYFLLVCVCLCVFVHVCVCARVCMYVKVYLYLCFCMQCFCY